MLEDFKKHLTEYCHCLLDQHFLLTVSGGIDSVVMANLFHASGIGFSIAHCNFQLRGEESDGDQQFVEALAKTLGVTFHVTRFETSAFARQNGISIQMAARDLRYAWFNDLANEFGYTYIATGHNKNDIIETMLLNLSRGTGIRGLMGIRPRHGNIIRPLLFASRLDILKYAGDLRLQWREDSSNSEIKYHRNKIRHTIMPAFNSINSAFEHNILNTINRLESTGKLLDVYLEQIKQAVWTELPDRVLINIEKLRDFPATDIVLFELLREFGITRLSLDAVINSFDSIPGKQFFTGTHNITRDRKYLIITKYTESGETETLIEPDTAFISHPIHLSFTIIDNAENFQIPRECNMAALDAGTITYPMRVRPWKTGDRFHPLGLKGSKKVSDYLVNLKIALPDKKKIWILESGGNIAWLVNHRIDDRFKICNKTRKILLIEYQE